MGLIGPFLPPAAYTIFAYVDLPRKRDKSRRQAAPALAGICRLVVPRQHP